MFRRRTSSSGKIHYRINIDKKNYKHKRTDRISKSEK